MPTLSDLETVCQKPHWRRVGSLLARRVARPLALYLTWLVVRWPVSANAVTAVALVVGLAAAGLLAACPAPAFVAGALLLQLWYLLDHVDGQVARYRSAESVTGVYFDFMMHHVVHPACAFALGYGIASRTGELAWSLAGAGFALGLVIQAVCNDCRYKACFSALARGNERRKAESEENAELKDGCWPNPAYGGPGPSVGSVVQTSAAHGSPQSGPDAKLPQGPFRIPRSAFRVARFLHRLCLNLCEMPNVVLAVTALAVVVALEPSSGLWASQLYVGVMAILAPGLALARLAKQVWRGLPDAEFRALADSKRTAISD